MTIGILGIKLGMTQIFDASGSAIPVTLINAGPCVITQVKTLANDGYHSVQIGYFQVAPSTLTMSRAGHLRPIAPITVKYLREYSLHSSEVVSVGDTVTLDRYSLGDSVCVTGTSIGKGFSGTVKRHKFARGPMTHGSKNHREPGSIGQGTTPGRVYPGKRMAGRLGNRRTTVKNLPIIHINCEHHLLVVKGSVPGKTGGLLSIVPSGK